MLNQHQTIKDNIKKFNKPNPLADYLIPFIEGKKEVCIFDLGSGPYSVIGSYFEEVDLHIHHMDNQDFSSFWKKYNGYPLVPIIHVSMENLPSLDHQADLVVCINALDHTKDAHAAVKEMIRVCKPGGWVYIECNLDQKDSSGSGHYWNAKESGVFTNGIALFDLNNFGFEIKYIDNGGEKRYNKIIATLKKND